MKTDTAERPANIEVLSQSYPDVHKNDRKETNDRSKPGIVAQHQATNIDY